MAYTPIYITNTLKRLFIVAFREIFASDADFPYNREDEKNTSIIITSKYVSPKTENTLPQIVVSTSSYSGSQDTFYNNFQEEVLSQTQPTSPTAKPTYLGKKSTKIIPFQVVFDVMSSVKNESEVVADKVFNSLSHTYVQLFDALGLNIRNVIVGEAIMRQQYPQYSFVTSVGATGDFRLTWTTEPNIDYTHIFTNIKFVLSITPPDEVL